MAWIESHQQLGRHPKTKAAARGLGISRVQLVGHLHYLWWWALDFAEDGDLSKVAPEDIAEEAMWDGDANQFMHVLQEAGFLTKDMHIHDWNNGRHSLPLRSAVRREWERLRRLLSPDVFLTDGYQCVYCKSVGTPENPLEVDHIIPVARGGTNDPGNLQTLCRSCNRAKGAN